MKKLLFSFIVILSLILIFPFPTSAMGCWGTNTYSCACSQYVPPSCNSPTCCLMTTELIDGDSYCSVCIEHACDWTSASTCTCGCSYDYCDNNDHCDDGDSCTEDICNDPTDDLSSCDNIDLSDDCNSDSECQESPDDPCTTDVCGGPSDCSKCSRTTLTDACDNDGDCGSDPCKVYACSNPTSDCSTCSWSYKSAGSDCGDCKLCNNLHACEYQCLGTESSCYCNTATDNCLDCSNAGGTDCGDGGCNANYKPSWICDLGTCDPNCGYVASCESTPTCSSLGEAACDSSSDCTWCGGDSTCKSSTSVDCQPGDACSGDDYCTNSCVYQDCGTSSCPSDGCYGSPISYTYKNYPSTCNRGCSGGSCDSCTCSPISTTDCSEVAVGGGCEFTCCEYGVEESDANNNCGDGKDNDCDGDTDDNDSGCSGTPTACSSPNTCEANCPLADVVYGYYCASGTCCQPAVTTPIDASFDCSTCPDEACGVEPNLDIGPYPTDCVSLCVLCPDSSGRKTLTGDSCVSSTADCEYSCVPGSNLAQCNADSHCTSSCDTACGDEDSEVSCNLDTCECYYPDCPTYEDECPLESGECCDNKIDDDCDGDAVFLRTDCGDGDCTMDSACWWANPCGEDSSYFPCSSFITLSEECLDPTLWLAGSACCYGIDFHVSDFSSPTTCCYTDRATITEPCPDKCQWSENHYVWHSDIPNTCTSTVTGWECDELQATMTDCLPAGECCERECDDATGCGALVAIDAKCEPFSCNPETCLCMRECLVRGNCADGQCCDAEIEGYADTGSCEPEGKIIPHDGKSWLCDPIYGWDNVEPKNDDSNKNVFNLFDFIFSIFRFP